MSRRRKSSKTFGSLKAAPAIMASSTGTGAGYSFTGSLEMFPSPGDTSQRGRRPDLDKPTWRMLSQSRQLALLSDARYLYTGSGAISGACGKMADYAVGWAWQPRYTGTNDAFRAAAEAVVNRWLESCDVRGEHYDWRTALRIASVSVDRDGDCFAVLTEDADTGAPRVQWISADRVRGPSSWATAGSPPVVPDLPETRGYAGRRIHCGVIYDDLLRPLGYNLAAMDGSTATVEWNIVPAESVVSIYDPKWFDQTRGIPSIISGILNWYDLNEVVTAETIAAKVNSSLALIETNETGRRELGREALGAASIPSGGKTGIQTQALERGLIRYIKSTGKLEAHKSDRPGNGWLALMEMLTRGGFAGMGLPMEFTWDSSKIGGAGVRSMVGQVQRAVENRQRVLAGPAKRILLYAVASYMRRGDIPFAQDWYEWDFSLPPLYSVDMGRDSQNRREDFAVGIRSISNILAEESITAREHFNTRANDYLLAKQISDERGVPLQWIMNPSASFGNTADQAIEEAAPTVGPQAPDPSAPSA